MGTAAQKERRARYRQDAASIIDAMSQGGVRSDADLRAFLLSRGLNPDGPLFKQYYSGGGYATYGPSWDPVWMNDFNTNQRIPHMGPGETWYDPSVASNWQSTPELAAARMRGFYRFWKDTPQGQALASQYGDNPIAAWYALRARSSRPNAPDESWHTEGTFNTPAGQSMSNVMGTPFGNVGAPNLSSSFAPPNLNRLSFTPPEVPIGPMSMTQPAPSPLGGEDTAWGLARKTLRRRYGSSLADSMTPGDEVYA